MNQEQYQQLTTNKERYFIEAVEILEGKMLSNHEMKLFGKIEQREGRPCEELVWWRLRPILHFKWSPKNGELRVLEIYKMKPEQLEPPTDENKI